MVISNTGYFSWVIKKLGTLFLGIIFFAIMSPAYSASKNILVLGDSLSAEYGLEQGTGWVPLLGKHLKQEKSAYNVINGSISGDSTSDGVSRLPALLKQYQPAVVVIELGSNDALRGLPLTMTKSNLITLVHLATAAHAKVLLIGMQIPPNYGKAYTTQFKKIFGEVAEETHAALVPFLMDHIAGNLDWFQQDQLHPNEKAQPTLLNNILPHLTPLLK